MRWKFAQIRRCLNFSLSCSSSCLFFPATPNKSPGIEGRGREEETGGDLYPASSAPSPPPQLSPNAIFKETNFTLASYGGDVKEPIEEKELGRGGGLVDWVCESRGKDCYYYCCCQKERKLRSFQRDETISTIDFSPIKRKTVPEQEKG